MKPTFVTTGSIAALVAAPLVLAGAVSAGAATASADTTPTPGPRNAHEALVDYVRSTQHLSTQGAEDYLDGKKKQQQKLSKLQRAGVGTDGAFFVGEKLTVVVDDAAQAATVEAHGLTPKVAAGQSDLEKVVARVQATHVYAAGQVAAVRPDIRTSKVVVKVTPSAPASAVAALKKMSPLVTVTTGAPLRAQTDVVPGRNMDMRFSDGSGGGCSLGFTGKKNGNNVLITAGHCVEGGPDVYSGQTHIGSTVDSRFRSGSASRDMGLVDIDSEDTGVPYVDTRGADGYIPVKGMSKNAVGTELCKAGRTTGWTCGVITGYGASVNYGGGTTVSNLVSSTVCTEPGDSGGAYIGVGDLAQGMTSGGPTNSDCGGFNSGWDSENESYYQPVVDAANYYGVTLDTAK